MHVCSIYGSNDPLVGVHEHLRACSARKARAVAGLYRLAEQADDRGDNDAFEQALEAAMAAEKRPAYMF